MNSSLFRCCFSTSPRWFGKVVLLRSRSLCEHGDLFFRAAGSRAHAVEKPITTGLKRPPRRCRYKYLGTPRKIDPQRRSEKEGPGVCQGPLEEERYKTDAETGGRAIEKPWRKQLALAQQLQHLQHLTCFKRCVQIPCGGRKGTARSWTPRFPWRKRPL